MESEFKLVEEKKYYFTSFESQKLKKTYDELVWKVLTFNIKIQRDKKINNPNLV